MCLCVWMCVHNNIPRELLEVARVTAVIKRGAESLRYMNCSALHAASSLGTVPLSFALL